MDDRVALALLESVSVPPGPLFGYRPDLIAIPAPIVEMAVGPADKKNCVRPAEGAWGVADHGNWLHALAGIKTTAIESAGIRTIFSSVSHTWLSLFNAREDQNPLFGRLHGAAVSRRHFLETLLKRSEGPRTLRNTRSGLAVATHVETAFSSADRKRGLLGRDGLRPGQALVIAPTNLVHTFAMRFPIDILFVARDGRVLKVSAAVPARRIAGSLRAFAVVEMAAGEASKSDTRAGDTIQVV